MAKQKTETVELLKSHTHRGVVYAPGTLLDLRPDQAKRLIDAGVAKGGARREG